MKKIVHIMIIWSNALKHKDHIVNELSKDFRIIKSFKVSWDKKLFKDNLSVFYSHSLKDKTNDVTVKIINNKCKRVGDGTFCAIVFEDSAPEFIERKTTSGTRTVNAHVFDKKIAFRKLTGGGSMIHCSDDEWETNKDLTILFGFNLPDFLKKYNLDSQNVEEINSNCIGIGGYDSIQQLFYVLNNTIKYCVLRNHECIPDEYTVEGHGDIDLMVEHRNYAVRLTKAKSVYPQPYRVYHIIKIAGKEIPFDFRFVGDNYYDPKWENDILEKRELQKSLFYTPNPTNQYYSLLYHAYVQKPWVKDDYPPKLKLYASNIGLEYKDEIARCIEQIVSFMQTNDYEFVRPNDKTVYYNTKNIKNLQVWNYLKNKIDNLTQIHDDYKSLSDFYYFKGIYEGRKVFVKYGGVGDTCQNEYIRTKAVYENTPQHFVEPIFLGKNGDDNYLISEWVDAISIEEYMSKASSEQKEDIKSQMIEIYNALHDTGIMHRDIRPGNFLVVGHTLKLIDFQYAIDSTNPKELSCVKENAQIAGRLGNKKFRYKSYGWRDSSSIIKNMTYLGIDTSDVKLTPDIIFYMPIKSYLRYKCSYIKSRIRKRYSRLKKK